LVKKIEESVGHRSKKSWLFFGLTCSLGVLFIFKYFNFFIGSRNFFLDFAGNHPSLEYLQTILAYGIPVGISFFTFQAVGYMLDVYTKDTAAEKNPLKFALFVSYFPQLVAGPIERFKNLHPQLFKHHALTYENLSNGLRLVLYGLFIKMVIADNLSPLADQVFNNPLVFSQLENAGGLLFFSIQIYADFHGYSLIAIGVSQVLGIRLMDNFKTPYFSASIKEFWSRWHISLSTWFRDYLYIPLGGNKVRYLRWMVNILIVFAVSGIWHGANFTFMVWGMLHGFIYLTEHFFTRKREGTVRKVANKIFGFVKTFLIVNLAWLFFRSDTLAQAYLSLSKIIGLDPDSSLYYRMQHYERGKSNPAIDDAFLNGTLVPADLTLGGVLVLVLSVFLVIELFVRQKRFDTAVGSLPFGLRWTIYAVLIYGIMALSGPDYYQFIYFQF
jgi:alginate O-acetyltransferase complex protein AlgI